MVVRRLGILALLALLLAACGSGATVGPDDLEVPGDAVARIVYFRAEDCEPCAEVEANLLAPLTERCGEQLEVKRVDIAEPEGYETFTAAEEAVIGEAGRWEVPVILLGDTYLIGQQAIEQELLPELQCVYGAGGNAWPDIPALTKIDVATPPAAGAGLGLSGDGAEVCVDEEAAAVCASPNPIFALYLTDAECADTCDRTRYDLRYLQGVYPQLFFEERALADNEALAQALADELGADVTGHALAPAVVVGEDYLTGDALTLDTLRATLDKYAESGATATWYTLNID